MLPPLYFLRCRHAEICNQHFFEFVIGIFSACCHCQKFYGRHRRKSASAANLPLQNECQQTNSNYQYLSGRQNIFSAYFSGKTRRTQKLMIMTCIPGRRLNMSFFKNMQSACTRFYQIQQFQCLSVSPDNILAWLEPQQQTYPTMLKLARIVLIPAVSAPRYSFLRWGLQ